jgi:hypothetical protein
MDSHFPTYLLRESNRKRTSPATATMSGSASRNKNSGLSDRNHCPSSVSICDALASRFNVSPPQIASRLDKRHVVLQRAVPATLVRHKRKLPQSDKGFGASGFHLCGPSVANWAAPLAAHSRRLRPPSTRQSRPNCGFSRIDSSIRAAAYADSGYAPFRSGIPPRRMVSSGSLKVIAIPFIGVTRLFAGTLAPTAVGATPLLL